MAIRVVITQISRCYAATIRTRAPAQATFGDLEGKRRGATLRAIALLSAMLAEEVVDCLVGGAFDLAIEVVFVPGFEGQAVETRLRRR